MIMKRITSAAADAAFVGAMVALFIMLITRGEALRWLGLI